MITIFINHAEEVTYVTIDRSDAPQRTFRFDREHNAKEFVRGMTELLKFLGIPHKVSTV